MEWTKVPTNLINGDFSDAEILAIVKYQLVYAMDEMQPSEKKLKRFLNKNQIKKVQSFINDIKTFVDCDIKSSTKIKNRNKRYYNKHKGLSLIQKQNSDVLQDVVCDGTDKNRNRIEIDKEKEINKEKENLNPDLIFDADLRDLFSCYEDKCKNLIPISFEKRNNQTLNLLNATFDEMNRDKSTFQKLCEKANSLEKIVNTKIDFRMMIKNYIGILNGQYEQKEHKEIEPVTTIYRQYEEIKDAF